MGLVCLSVVCLPVSSRGLAPKAYRRRMGQQIRASKVWWGRRSAPVGPLGADLRVAPCVDTDLSSSYSGVRTVRDIPPSLQQTSPTKREDERAVSRCSCEQQPVREELRAVRPSPPTRTPIALAPARGGRLACRGGHPKPARPLSNVCWPSTCGRASPTWRPARRAGVHQSS